MDSARSPDTEDRPGIAALARQLVDDTGAFARAEAAYLRAQVGERANYALPGLIMCGVGVALGFGAIVALLVGLIIWLAQLWGAGLAVLAVIVVSLILASLLLRFGIARLRKATKAPHDRTA